MRLDIVNNNCISHLYYIISLARTLTENVSFPTDVRLFSLGTYGFLTKITYIDQNTHKNGQFNIDSRSLAMYHYLLSSCCIYDSLKLFYKQTY